MQSFPNSTQAFLSSTPSQQKINYPRNGNTRFTWTSTPIW